MANEVALYWPAGQLQKVIRARSPEREDETILAHGFRLDNAVVVVNFTREGSKEPLGQGTDGFNVVACVWQRRKGVSGQRKNSVELGIEYDPGCSRHADRLDQSIRFEDRDGEAPQRRHVILYDLSIVQNNAGSRSTWSSSPILEPLQALHSKLQSSTSEGTETHRNVMQKCCGIVGYFCLHQPVSLIKRVWQPLDSALSAPLLKWIPLGSGDSFKDYSTTLNLLSIRLALALQLPDQIRNRYTRGSKHTSAPGAGYTGIADAVVYFLLDYVCGLVLQHTFATFLSSYALSTNLSPGTFLDSLRLWVVWLMGAPAGFKLNLRLASILGNGVLLWLDFWQFVFATLDPSQLRGSDSHLRSLVFSMWKHGGLTMQLCLLADALWLITWNSTWVLKYFTKLNRMQFGILSSLWKLFLGKKKNVLRKRVDSCEYDVNQLLLGTLLFTILVFLVATNTVFLVFFGLVRLVVWAVWLALWTPVVVLRGVPLVSIVHRLLMPRAYPGAGVIEAIDTVNNSEASMIIDDVSAGPRRERDAVDVSKLKVFLATSKGASTMPIFFRVVYQASPLGALFTRLEAYRTAVGKVYTSGSISKSLRSGEEIATVDPRILFFHSVRGDLTPIVGRISSLKTKKE